MQSESDVVLVGNGLATLIAARQLHDSGKQVTIINPDWDFFQEDSELSLDPFWLETLGEESVGRLRSNLFESTLEILRPSFPGSLEYWQGEGSDQREYYDLTAPHVRARDRVWIVSEHHLAQGRSAAFWEKVEGLYLGASDARMDPKTYDGLLAAKRIPGFSGEHADDYKAVAIPRLADVDVDRYRNGILEFLYERIGDSVIRSAEQIELTKEGLKLFSPSLGVSGLRTFSVRSAVVIFWTPRLTHLVRRSIDSLERLDSRMRPEGIRVLEEWTLGSREPLDPSTVGSFEGAVVWAGVSGRPDEKIPSYELSVLRSGPLLELKEQPSASGMTWASKESFEQLNRLTQEFLGWEHFSVRSMKPRSVFEWGQDSTESVQISHPSQINTFIVPQCDGPIAGVVQTAQKLVERIL